MLARVRDRKTRDLGEVRCIKGVDVKVLVEESKIRGDDGVTFLSSLLLRGL